MVILFLVFWGTSILFIIVARPTYIPTCWKWKSLSRVQLFATPWMSMAFSRPEYFFFSRGSPNPGIKPKSPTLQASSLPDEPQGKPKNTGEGSLSLLQWIFSTQVSNRGLLPCKWILYQLSSQGSPSHLCTRAPKRKQLLM